MDFTFPEYSLGTFPLQLPPEEQAGFVDSVLAGVEENGLVNIVPAGEEQAFDLRSQKIRMQTIATRLWLLGYLPQKLSGRQIEKDFRRKGKVQQAIRKFQTEAGLTVDGWVGDETWYALDALVSFESDTQVNRWFAGDTPLPVLQRAAQLRLFSLGLYDEKPDVGFREFPASGFNRFTEVVRLLRLSSQVIGPGFFPNTLGLLFNQDQLVEALAKQNSSAAGSFTVHFFGDRDEQERLVNRFVVNMAKIELWLLGFDVQIDGRDDYSVAGMESRTEVGPLDAALNQYYRDFEEGRLIRAAGQSNRITPAFFISLQKTAGTVTETSDDPEDLSREVAALLDRPGKIEQAWNYIRKRGVRLWDGLRRLWRWVKRLGEKVLGFLEENVFRAFFRYVSKSFKIVRKAVECVAESVKGYLRGFVEAGDPRLTLVHTAADFDYTILLNPAAAPPDLQFCAAAVKRQSEVFQLASRIVGFLIRLLKRILIGPAGWAQLLAELARSLGELKPLYFQLKELTGEAGPH
ncbi:MAG TPA: peptidoglycan-binding domain-containing protein [Prolixibacteraceae bacterium]|nr:peptidoglycan-binding domain-containing protein [Prolixibacteraceae bacterium]